MKAIRVEKFGEPEVMQLVDVPEPQPVVNQVLVRVRAIGVNPVDTYIRSGNYARKPALPYTPGSDAAGEIEAVGSGVGEFQKGDRVYFGGTASGAYAELAVCDVADVHPLPKNVTFAQGAAIGVPYATAYRALFFRGKARAGETVLVHGATGGVGTAAIQLARAAGLRVLGTGGTDEGRKHAREHGTHEVFDHHASDYLAQILDATNGRGVDLILEMLANVNLGKDLGVLAKQGRVVVIGSRGEVEIDPRDTMSRDADIRGMVLFNASPEELAAIHAGIFAGLENGTLRPVIGRELPLAEAPAAHRAVMEPGALGKIILTV
jgi:NADPH:quinone reductase